MKKLVCALLVCVMVCMSAVAYAVPESTTQETTSVTDVTTSTDATVDAGFAIKIGGEETYSTTELGALSAFVKNNDVAPVNYFTQSQAVSDALAALVPEDFDVNTLSVHEFAPLTETNYAEDYGDVTATLTFATQYSPMQTLVAMIGVVTGEDADGNPIVEWTALKAEAVADESDPEKSAVKVLIPQALQQQMASLPAMIAILSNDLVEPTAEPTVEPATAEPTVEPTVEPTAEPVPSKTTQDMASVTGIASADGAQVGEDFTIEIIEEQEYSKSTLGVIATYTESNQATAAGYFAQADTVAAQIAELLPEDFDVSTLVMYEFAPLTAINYDPEYGDVVATMVFATKYSPDQTLVALVGIVKGVDEDGAPIVEWTALKAEAVENEADPEKGCVRVYFPQELLPEIENGNAMIAILSDEIVEE